MSDWDNYFTTIALVICLLLTVPLLVKLCKSDDDHSIRSDSDIQVEEDRSFLPLMKYEGSFAVMIHGGVSTVNFFPAQDVDYEVSKQKLRARLFKICEANPWLVGTIGTNKKRHQRVLCSFPNTITDEDIDAVFFSSEASDDADKISSSTPYMEMAKVFDQLGALVHSGYKILNKPNCRMCKVSYFPINGGKEFAFVFSVAHPVADGYTYYKLLSMFKDDSTIESLKVQRLDNFDDVLVRNIGEVEKKMFESPSIIFNIIWRALFATPQSKMSANYVDPAKIIKAKQEAKEYGHSDDPNFYVSTNDIITSAFGKAVDCGILMTLLNLRGREQATDKSLAGNYQAVVWYDKDGYDTSSRIRQSLNRGPPFKRISDKGPMTRWQQMTTDVAMISSWIFPSFDGDIHLWNKDGSPSSLVMLHLPLYAKPSGFPTVLVFKPCKGKIGVFCIHSNVKNDFYKRLLDNGNLLGETVRQGMFASK